MNMAKSHLPKRANLVNIFLNLLAADKAIYSRFWHLHWTAKGKNFYGQHLQYQRIYEETQEEIDSLSEKFIAFFGKELLNFKDLCDLEFKYIKDFNIEPLEAQEKYLRYLVKTKKYLRDNDLINSVLGNTIELMIDKHITHYYLIKQSDPERNKKIIKESKSIDKKLLKKVNEQLKSSGFNENKIFEKPQQAWHAATKILEENGIKVDDEEFFEINYHFTHFEHDLKGRLNVKVIYENDGTQQSNYFIFTWFRPQENEVYKIKSFCYIAS